MGDEHEDVATASLIENLDRRRPSEAHLVPVRGEPSGGQQRSLIEQAFAAGLRNGGVNLRRLVLAHQTGKALE